MLSRRLITIVLATISVLALGCLTSCKEKTEVLVKSVKVDQSSIVLTEGETATISYTIEPDNALNKTVQFSSSDESVAKVNNSGLVTAVSPGKATITVASADGPKATVQVSVQAKKIAVTGVELDQSKIAITVGNTATLKATVKPDNATDKGVSWKSSDESIATVSDGVVKGVKPGTADITVTTNDGGKTASCKVTVHAAVVSVTGVSLDKTELTLTEGETATLTATVKPDDATDKSVSWSSSKPDVATVSDGVVSAVAPGTATITVTTNNGGKTATCAVTVNAKDVPAAGVTIEPSTVDIMEGQTFQLKATVSPEGADQRVEWAAQNKDVATVDENGLVTAVSPGSTRIIARSKTNTQIQGYCEVTVTPDTSLKGITLDAAEIQLKIGTSRTLTVVYTPEYAANKNVSWTSSDPAVALVNDGTVTALSEGSATVTATSEEGGFKASCTVIVSKSEGPLVYFIKRGSDLYVNGELDTLTGLYDSSSGKYRSTDYLDSDGKDLYACISYGYSWGEYWFSKNHKPVISLVNNYISWPQAFSARNGVYAIMGNVGQYGFEILRATEAGGVQHFNVPTTSNNIYSYSMAVAPDGNIYSAVSLQDPFHNPCLNLYTIKPDGSIKEQVILENPGSAPHIAISDEGDVYVFLAAYNDANHDVGLLLKNGVQEALIDEVDYNFQGTITCKGGHVYTAVLDYVKKEIRIHKDGKTIYTISGGSDSAISLNYHSYTDLRIANNGDVYLLWNDGNQTYYISKNGKVLYTSDDIISYLCIVE